MKTKGAIAAGDPLTAEAGNEMFRLGGNAFDAAIAASFASFTSEAALTSAGGGGFLLSSDASGRQRLFDFFVQTPLQKKKVDQIEFYPVELNFGEGTQVFHIGGGSMAVPGNVAGLFHVHEQLGSLPIDVVIAPAIDYARNGITYSHYQAKVLRVVSPSILALGEDGDIFLKDGQLLNAGDPFRNRAFANALEELCREGPRSFYEGDIARLLMRASEKHLGHLTRDDLLAYRVIERAPITTTYRGCPIISNPMPALGGVLVAFTLKLLERFELGKMDYGGAEHIKALVHAFDFTNIGRANFLHDHWQAEEGFDPEDPAQLKAFEAYLSGRHKPGNTTHISTVDQHGNAAAVTTSHGEGSGVVIPETGIVMNNMLGEADLNPIGFHQWEPSKRIPSMMAPSFVLKDGRPQTILGTGGSNRIRTAMVQVLSNLIDYNLSLEEAVRKPRLHLEQNILDAEPGDYHFDEALLSHLGIQLKNWTDINIFFGGVHAVSRNEQGHFTGAGDLRRNGCALARQDY